MFNKRLLKEFKGERSSLAAMVFCQWTAMAANVVFMSSTAFLAGQVFNHGGPKEAGIRNYVLTAATVLLIRMAAATKRSSLEVRIASKVKSSLRKKIYEKLLHLGSNYHEKTATSEIVQISTEGVEQLEFYMSKYVPQFFYSMLAPLTLFFIVGTLSLKTAAVLFVCVPLIPLSIVAVQKFAKRLLGQYWGTYTELGDSFLENLQGLTTLKIYQADDVYADRMDEEAEKFRKITMRVLIMQLNSISVMDIVAYGGAALGIVVSLIQFRSGALDFRQCLFIILISAEFFLPLRMLGSFFHIAMNGNAAADKIFRFLDLEERNSGSAGIGEGKQAIYLENVVFQYEEKGKTVLDHIDLKVIPGKFTAIVGESGCGKSTIASLCMGEYQNYGGEIRIGGCELREIKEKDRMKLITRINHNSYLFKGTVEDNLRMGNPSASVSDMEHVLRQTGLLSEIRERGGLKAAVTEAGVNFSGGQRQRLALSRALLRDSEVYIFDEATSNVDAESENAIMDVIYQMSAQKTVILISHRLANVTGADMIYAMDHGRIAEKGRHEDLVREKGIYHSLYLKQQELEQYGHVWEGGEAVGE